MLAKHFSNYCLAWHFSRRFHMFPDLHTQEQEVVTAQGKCSVLRGISGFC